MLFFLGIAIAASLALLPDANTSLFLFEKFKSFSSDNDHDSHYSYYKSKFQNKRIWITGASSGIDEEMAIQLCSHGAKIIISGRREHELQRVRQLCLSLSNRNRTRARSNKSNNEEVLDSGDKSLQSCTNGDKAEQEQNGQLCIDSYASSNVRILPFDMMDKDNMSDIVREAIGYYQGIDILILNAGVGQLSPTLNESMDTTRFLMELNFHSPVQLAMEVIKQDQWGIDQKEVIMTNEKKKREHRQQRKRQGHIVLTSSVAAKLPLPLGSSYAASKHAAHGYFSSLRSECNSWLRVDLPCPGPINTNFQTKALTKNNSDNTGTDNENFENDEDSSEVKMSAHRCAKLIIAAMSGNKILMQETWISKQPTLFFMYLNQFFPRLSNWLLGIIGSLRLKAFDAGLPLYKVSSWIKAAKIENKVEEYE